MPQTTRRISLAFRVIGATLFAVVLWGIVSLSDQFDITLDVPLSVETPPNFALADAVPASIKVRVRASGWNLMKILVSGRVESVLRPQLRSREGTVTVGYGRRELLASIRTNIPETQQLSVYPDTLTVVLGPEERKTVPLRPAVTIATRSGFDVIGPVTVAPDSVVLVGSGRALAAVTSWTTEPLELNDVHRPIVRPVPLNDTLRGIVTPMVRRAEIYADVQEIAERTFTDLPVLNRGRVSDSTVRLLLYPSRVQAIIRGGARDLGRLDPSHLRAYVQVLSGADTSGVAYPQLLLPAGLNLEIVSVKPSRIRYIFRREAVRKK